MVNTLLPPALSRRISPARSAAVTARVGIALGIGVVIVFLTGLISHLIQHPPEWFWWPAHPVWLYRVTQGIHVTVGVMLIPLLLIKLWSVYPRLFLAPVFGKLTAGIADVLERLSIAVLIGAMIFQLVTGLFNTAQYYPWKFFFPTTHYAMAYVALGALAVHLAVKLPVVRQALARPVVEPEPESSPAPEPTSLPEPEADSTLVPDSGRVQETQPQRATGLSRRALLTAAGVGAAVAGLAIAGQTVPFLRWVSLLAPRSGEGPQGIPINRTAEAAAVTTTARAADYALRVTVGGATRTFSRADLEALPQHDSALPIACVEGWSAQGIWRGVRLHDLLARVGEYRGGDVRFVSLETTGIYGSSTLPRPHVIDDSTLIALRLNGEELSLDHGYPCRLIAPNRPGVLQTKWLKSIEELT